MKKKYKLEVTYDCNMIQKLYNLGFSFPKVKAIINNKKFTKMKIDIKQKIIISILYDAYLIKGVIRVAPVISSINSNVRGSNFQIFSKILLKAYEINSIVSKILNIINIGIPNVRLRSTE